MNFDSIARDAVLRIVLVVLVARAYKRIVRTCIKKRVSKNRVVGDLLHAEPPRWPVVYLINIYLVRSFLHRPRLRFCQRDQLLRS